MSTLVVIAACFLGVASAGFVAPTQHYAAPAAVIRPHIPHSAYRAQDTVGQYKYGFVSADGIQRSETRGADGSVIGRYSYVSPEGQIIDIGYSGGAAGFNAAGTGIPIPVADTPEVAAAKSVHYAAHIDAAARAAVDPVGYDGYGGFGGYNGLGYGGPIVKYH